MHLPIVAVSGHGHVAARIVDSQHTIRRNSTTHGVIAVMRVAQRPIEIS